MDDRKRTDSTNSDSGVSSDQAKSPKESSPDKVPVGIVGHKQSSQLPSKKDSGARKGSAETQMHQRVAGRTFYTPCVYQVDWERVGVGMAIQIKLMDSEDAALVDVTMVKNWGWPFCSMERIWIHRLSGTNITVLVNTATVEQALRLKNHFMEEADFVFETKLLGTVRIYHLKGRAPINPEYLRPLRVDGIFWDSLMATLRWMGDTVPALPYDDYVQGMDNDEQEDYNYPQGHPEVVHIDVTTQYPIKLADFWTKHCTTKFGPAADELLAPGFAGLKVLNSVYGELLTLTLGMTIGASHVVEFNEIHGEDWKWNAEEEWFYGRIHTSQQVTVGDVDWTFVIIEDYAPESLLDHQVDSRLDQEPRLTSDVAKALVKRMTHFTDFTKRKMTKWVLINQLFGMSIWKDKVVYFRRRKGRNLEMLEAEKTGFVEFDENEISPTWWSSVLEESGYRKLQTFATIILKELAKLPMYQ